MHMQYRYIYFNVSLADPIPKSFQFTYIRNTRTHNPVLPCTIDGENIIMLSI